MAAVTLVLFDMDNVLCDYSRPARVAHLAELTGRSDADVFDAIFASGYESQGDAGRPDYLHGFGERLGYPLSAAEWADARRAGTRARPEMLALVRRLRVRSAILTNNPAILVERLDTICPELRPLFGDRIIASATLQAAKPDPDCFRHCLHRLGGAPAETLFIDDLQKNVEGAIQAGLAAHRFTTPAACADFLAANDVL